MAYKNGHRVASNTTALRRVKQLLLDEDRYVHVSKNVLPVYVDAGDGLECSMEDENAVFSHFVVERRKGRTYRKPKDGVQNRNENQETTL